MGFKTWVSETLTASDLNNYLMKQANIRTTVGSEPTGEEGMRVIVTDRDQERTYTGSAWNRTGWYSSSGRTGCTLQVNSSQTIANASDITILWDTETTDSDGFYPGSGGTITIPTGCGGLYAAMFKWFTSAPVGTLGADTHMVRNGTIWPALSPADVEQDTHTWFPILCSAGDTITFTVKQTSGGSIGLTGRVDLYWMGA